MAKNDPKKLEKALAKQARRDARKSKEQSKKDMIQNVYSGEFSLANAQKWDLLECWVSESWNDPKHLCQLLVVRRASGGQIGVGLFLIDLGCLGIKDANATGFASYGEFQDGLLEELQDTQGFVQCELDFAAKLVKTAIAYARKLGFEPHKDTKKAMRMLGDAQADNCEVEIPTGVDGKPHYVNGPYENPMRVVNTLNRTVGEGNYTFILMSSDFAEFGNDLEDDDFDEDDFDEEMDEAELSAITESPEFKELTESPEFKELMQTLQNFQQSLDETGSESGAASSKVIDVEGRTQQ
jgi:hypothetical protein